MVGGARPVLPRLRADAYLVPTGDGARILTNHGAETFTGASIHSWLRTLAPYLDGTRTVEDLVAPLPADKRDLVRRIVSTLAERGLVRDGPDQPGGEFGYLDTFVPDAHRALEDYRDARILLVGSGRILTELARVLAQSGANQVRIAADVATAANTDLVVQVSDRSAPERALAVDRACREWDLPVVHGIRRGGELWVGTDGLESAWRRLNRWVGWPDPDGPLPEDAVAVAAGMLGMAAFRQLTGIAEHTMSCLDLATLRTTTHRFLPYRNGSPTTDQSFADRIAELRAGAALEPETLDADGTRLVDPRLGVLGEVSERDFAQLPVNVAAVRVAGWSSPVTGAGLTVRDARWRAVLAGVAAYAATTVDPARLLDGRVRGVRLSDGSIRLVDRDSVFTVPDQPLAGVAARYTWSDAVSSALLDRCACPLPGTEPVRLNPADLDPDQESGAYLRMLDILGVRLTIDDVTGPLRVPTLAFRSGDRTVAVISAYRAQDALADGLRAVVLDEQARRARQPAYAPSGVMRTRPAVTTGGPPAPCTEAGLIEALLANGFDPVAIPLDHDAEVHRIVPYIARVVLADA
jgi:hypothetical protein